ncbi:MAG TPA: hypothetical protein VF384_07285 [Planctomycetota bacterium]
MHNSCRTAALVALAALSSSCFTSVGKWTYPSGRYPTTASHRAAKAFVLVEPLLDQRGTDNRSCMAWSYVPVFPFGWTHFDRPEATVPDPDTTRYTADPCFDLARAIVIELRRQGLVEHAEFTSDYQRGRGETHVLRGTLRAFFVAEERWTYGLSIYAPVVWALGLPMGTSANGFCVDLELVEASSGRVAWAATVFDSDDWTEGYYYGPEWYRFGWMWERRLRQQLGDLARALGAEPAPLPDALRRELDRDPPRMPPSLLEASRRQLSGESGPRPPAR